MAYLYERIEDIRDMGYSKSMPGYIKDNLNPHFELRSYQILAFENFITYFESNDLRAYPAQTLFHMATGSGKTLIMAGLIIYLYKMGYRNFLFFVNLSNIVRKTKDNFLNETSSKYLFAPEIVIDGERVPLNDVRNFQYADDNAINICFTTTQSLHADMWMTKENSLSPDDFADRKIVLISDEAHHLNADTLQGNTSKMNLDEEASYHSWEATVRNILVANKDNVLLEFTATCDTGNPSLQAAYANKIIFDYPLYKFREDKYSKEIKTLRSDSSLMDRELQAILLSQYRLKVFQDNRIFMKPVVLFKSAKIADSRQHMADFLEMINRLTEDDIGRIRTSTDSDIMKEAFRYFEEKKISFAVLSQELKEDFGEAHVISANDDKEAEERQLLLNSLEDYDNPYRAIFEVKKLDEGWDVLNLFDIVRLYETRTLRNGHPGKSTVSEAQLIGRGARYCPFVIEEGQQKFQRKFDHDTDNPLRICEELYYHCQNNSGYIDELKTALREVGIDLDKTVNDTDVNKNSFRKKDSPKDRIALVNSSMIQNRENVYIYSAIDGRTGEDTLLDDRLKSVESVVEAYKYTVTIADIADYNYSIVNKALCQFSIFQFNTLKQYFPKLRSTREFIYGEDYLGEIKIEITSRYAVPTPDILLKACKSVLSTIADDLA